MKKTQMKEIYAGKSGRKAILLFCHECMGYDGHRGGKTVKYGEAGTEVAKCTARKCPLWPYRQMKKEPIDADWLD